MPAKKATRWSDKEIADARARAARAGSEDAAQEAALALLQMDPAKVRNKNALAKKIAIRADGQERRRRATADRAASESAGIDLTRGKLPRSKIRDHEKLCAAVRELARKKLERSLGRSLRPGFEDRILAACKREQQEGAVADKEWSHDRQACVALLRALHAAVARSDYGRSWRGKGDAPGDKMLWWWVDEHVRPLLEGEVGAALERSRTRVPATSPRNVLVYVCGPINFLGTGRVAKAGELAAVGLLCGWLPVPRRAATPNEVLRAEELACNKELKGERITAEYLGRV